MDLRKLNALLRPPSEPIEIPSSDEWSETEKKLGALPADYKAFVNEYGTGYIDTFLYIFNPVSKNKYCNLIWQLEPTLNSFRYRREHGEKIPYPLFPEPAGLLPLGVTDNGDTLFWYTRGNPDDWPMVVNPSRSNEWYLFNLCFIDFLLKVLQGEVRNTLFPDDFPSSTPKFEIMKKRLR